MVAIFDDFPRGVPGTGNKGALLATVSWSATAPKWQPGMILLGLDDDGNEVGHLDDRHLVTVAGYLPDLAHYDLSEMEKVRFIKQLWRVIKAELVKVERDEGSGIASRQGGVPLSLR